MSVSSITKLSTELVKTLEANVLNEHCVYELLKEVAFLGVVESNRIGGGRAQGSYLEDWLVQDASIVLQSVLRDSRLKDFV